MDCRAHRLVVDYIICIRKINEKREREKWGVLWNFEKFVIAREIDESSCTAARP
jgi:hypothetical protein